MRLTAAGDGLDAGGPSLVVERRTTLLGAWTAGTIAIGFMALLVATLALPLSAGIAIPGREPACSSLFPARDRAYTAIKRNIGYTKKSCRQVSYRTE